MRVALVLVAVLGCSTKQQAPSPASEPVMAPTPPPPPPPAGGANEAREQARASGVLGPTEGSAFDEVKQERKPETKGTAAVASAPAAPPHGVTITSASSDDLMKASQKRLAAVRACYDKSLAKQPTLAGELTLAITNGAVTVERSTVHDADLEKCVVGAVRAAALPKSATKASLVLAFKAE